MKKFMASLTVGALLFASLTGCSTKQEVTPAKETATENSEKYTIGIVQTMNHPSLDEIREYTIIGLEELGLKDKIEIVYKDAQGDPSNINTIVSQFVGEEVNMIIPIATGAAQTTASATKDIPIVFAAVSNPVEAGLVKDLKITDSNITGVSNAIAVEEILDLSQELTPGIKTYGLIYNQGEINSATGIKRAKAYLSSKGYEYVEATIANSGELLQATQSLIGKNVDAIFTPNDNTVATAMPILASEAIKAKIPVYVGVDSLVKDGGLATVGIDYKTLGRQVAAMVKRIYEGQTIAENPVEQIKENSKIINKTTAEALGLKIDETSLKEFKIIE
ncbi:MAG: ABC-type uncharacterized transport system, periplasmic component [Bacillota bacterium]|jgi:putative ABC transport system substrate-binding protein|nr:ABC-type uncharacterized transport system, periplasmic component [Bacillota bacterium]